MGHDLCGNNSLPHIQLNGCAFLLYKISQVRTKIEH